MEEEVDDPEFFLASLDPPFRRRASSVHLRMCVYVRVVCVQYIRSV